MFRFDKWYLDCVTADGTAWIGYAGRLAWGGLGVSFASTLESPRSAPPVERTAVRGLADPVERDGAVEWRCPGLGVEGRWTPIGPAPLADRLLDRGTGTIDWHAAVPHGTARVAAGAAVHEGLGYVERLHLTIPPWRFPFRTLRWGRYLGPRHSAVWIDWTGRVRRHWIWIDGVADRAARLTDAGIVAGSGLAFEWAAARNLRDQPILALLTDHLPAVARRLTGRLDRMHEHKMLSAGAMVRGSAVIERGWIIHEVVRW